MHELLGGRFWSTGGRKGVSRGSPKLSPFRLRVLRFISERRKISHPKGEKPYGEKKGRSCRLKEPCEPSGQEGQERQARVGEKDRWVSGTNALAQKRQKFTNKLRRTVITRVVLHKEKEKTLLVPRNGVGGSPYEGEPMINQSNPWLCKILSGKARRCPAKWELVQKKHDRNPGKRENRRHRGVTTKRRYAGSKKGGERSEREASKDKDKAEFKGKVVTS